MRVVLRRFVVFAHCAVIALAVIASEVPRCLPGVAMYTTLLYASVTVARIPSRQLGKSTNTRLLSPLWVPVGPRYDPRGNQRATDLAHEVRGRAAPQLAIVRRFGRS